MNENLGWIGKIYPDECAYSIASRLAVATLGCSQYRTNCILFGSARNLEVYVHQPLKRKNLEQWGMDASRSGYEKHVQEHSIYPLYSIAIDEEYQDSFATLINGDELPKMQNARLSKRMKTKYLRKNSLCFCPLCMKQETEQFGEPYWHRLHQIPGVTCCPKHRVKLIQAITLKDIRWKFIPAYCFISGKQMDDIKAEDDKWNIQIAEDVEWLLDHGFEPSIRKGYWDIIVNLENPKYYRNNYWTGLDKYLDIERKGDTFLNPEQENNYLPMKRPNYLSMLLFLEALGIDIRTL